MRYLCLLIGEPDIEAPMPGTPEFAQMLSDFESATRTMAADGVLVDSGPLQPPSAAATLRVRDGRPLVTDGAVRGAQAIQQGSGGYADAGPAPTWHDALRPDRRRPAPTHLRLLPSGAGPRRCVALMVRTRMQGCTSEIARSFLVSEATLAQRLVRAKRKIRAAGIPFRIPADEDLPGRIGGVMRVVYLVFTEGHQASTGSRVVRGELCDEAVRLARLLAGLCPGDPEVLGLLAVLLITDARRRRPNPGDPARSRPRMLMLRPARPPLLDRAAIADDQLRRSPLTRRPPSGSSSPTGCAEIDS